MVYGTASQAAKRLIFRRLNVAAKQVAEKVAQALCLCYQNPSGADFFRGL
jgi:hypothetical protein